MAARPRPGEMRESITIQKPTETTADVYGATADTWSDLYKVNARVETETARETFRGAQVQAEAAVMVGMYYRAGIDGTMRVLVDGRILSIDGVSSDPRKTRTYLTCHEAL